MRQIRQIKLQSSLPPTEFTPKHKSSANRAILSRPNLEWVSETEESHLSKPWKPYFGIGKAEVFCAVPTNHVHIKIETYPPELVYIEL